MKSPRKPKLSLANRRLFKAVTQGNLDRVERIMSGDEKVDPNCKDEFGRPLAFVAVMKNADFHKGDPILALLLNHPKMNINLQTTNQGYTLLHYAAEKSLVWVVRRLLGQTARIDLSIVTKKGQRAEQLASNPEVKGLFLDFARGVVIAPEVPDPLPGNKDAAPTLRRQKSAPGKPLPAKEETKPGALLRRKTTGTLPTSEAGGKRSIFSLFGKGKKAGKPAPVSEVEPLLQRPPEPEPGNEENDGRYEVEKLKVELELTGRKCEKAKETETSLRKELDEARRQIEALQKGEGKKAESAVRKELKAARREIEDLRETETELREELAERMRVIEKLQRVVEGEPKLRKELIEANRELKILKRSGEGESAGLRGELENAKRKLEKLQGVEKELSEARRELADLKSQPPGETTTGGEVDGDPTSALSEARREIEELKAAQVSKALAPFRLAGIKFPRHMPSTEDGRNRLFDALTRLQVTLWDSRRS